jgi:hypothetical protein
MCLLFKFIHLIQFMYFTSVIFRITFEWNVNREQVRDRSWHRSTSVKLHERNVPSGYLYGLIGHERGHRLEWEGHRQRGDEVFRYRRSLHLLYRLQTRRTALWLFNEVNV